jgi:hypothetical protein
VRSQDVEERHDGEVDRSAEEEELPQVRPEVPSAILVPAALLSLPSSYIVEGGRG